MSTSRYIATKEPRVINKVVDMYFANFLPPLERYAKL